MSVSANMYRETNGVTCDRYKHVISGLLDYRMNPKPLAFPAELLSTPHILATGTKDVRESRLGIWYRDDDSSTCDSVKSRAWLP